MGGREQAAEDCEDEGGEEEEEEDIKVGSKQSIDLSLFVLPRTPIIQDFPQRVFLERKKDFLSKSHNCFPVIFLPFNWR